jgi:hypothetical protein
MPPVLHIVLLFASVVLSGYEFWAYFNYPQKMKTGENGCKSRLSKHRFVLAYLEGREFPARWAGLPPEENICLLRFKMKRDRLFC